jgi:4-amino-4-deoxy-L-arabinose transferase-like glycosyltransferase
MTAASAPGAPGEPAQQGNTILWAVCALFVFVTAGKFLIAGNMDLFYDEATYWQASLRLDSGYTHTLMMTPFLIRVGTFIFGDTLLGARMVFVLCSAALPFAIYLLAQPMVGRRDAILAAGFTQIMPISALMGQAYMDPAMFLFTVLALAAFERARRNDNLLAWLSLGVMVAAGIATHYRFAPFLLGLLAYLVITRRGRGLWKRPGLWISGLVGAIGLVPVIYFNLETGFAGFKYQVIDRAPWTFQTKGLLFLVEQFAVVTPLLFIALMGALVSAVKRARNGDDDRALLAIIAAVYIGFYLVLAPLSDMRREHMHWPAAGYLPLFVLLPGVLRAFGQAGARTVTARARRVFQWLVSASGVAAVAVVLVFLGAWSWPSAGVPDSLRHGVRHGLLNWSLAKAKVTRVFVDHYGMPNGKVTMVASNYKVGSELEYMFRPADGVFVLDNPTNIRNGIAPQLTIWKLDEKSLRRDRAGQDALIVLDSQDHGLNSDQNRDFRRNLCAVFGAVRPIGDFVFSDGRRRLLFYKGRVNQPDAPKPKNLGPETCAVLPAAHMARPRYGDSVRGLVSIHGWATQAGTGIKKVEILVDGKPVADARYGWRDPRAAYLMPGSKDPNFPKVGYIYHWDSKSVANGRHRIAVRTHGGDGKTREHGRRWIFVKNR